MTNVKQISIFSIAMQQSHAISTKQFAQSSSACSIMILWDHIGDAMKSLKCMSISFQWVWSSLHLIKYCHCYTTNKNIIISYY